MDGKRWGTTLSYHPWQLDTGNPYWNDVYGLLIVLQPFFLDSKKLASSRISGLHYGELPLALMV